MLQVNSFSKIYNEYPVLEIKKLDIPEGIHLLQGVNGSGKSTFMQCVNGITGYKGEIIFNGTSFHKSPVHYRQQLSYSEAEPKFPPFLTAREIAAFVAKTKNAGAQEIEQLLERFQMKEFVDKPIGTYSSGMLKKTSLLLAFLGKPKLILLDEPFTTIDATTFGSLVGLIKERHREGVGFILSTHHKAELRNLEVENVYYVENNTIKLR